MTRWLPFVAMLLPLSAQAQDKPRDYCPARPGLGTPACTMAPGTVSVETALGDWTLERQDGDRTDTILIGDTQVRVGLTDRFEGIVGWTPYGLVRERSAGSIDRRARTGDVTLGLKANFAHPDGEGFAIAALPFVTLPVGRRPVGTGDWGAGVLLPVSFDLTKVVSVELVPEVDAAVNEGGRGRHFAASMVGGLGLALSDKVTLEVEGQVLRDDDPAGRTTQRFASASLAFKANDDLQFDVGGVAGLDRSAPDVELYAGIARRF